MVSGVPRQTLMNIRGLITTPNEYGVYPEGSAAKAENMLARSANQWIAARDTLLYDTSGVNGYLIYRIFGISPGYFMTIEVSPSDFETGWICYQNGSVTTPFTTEPASLVTSFQLFNKFGYLTPTIFRNRVYLNSRKGVLVCDTNAPSSAPLRILRTAGLVQPRVSFFSFTFGSAGDAVLATNAIVTYSVVVRRVAADGYTLISPPSPPTRFWSYSVQMKASLDVRWAFPTDYRVGDMLELYRSAGIVTTDSTTDSGTSMRLVATLVLDAAAIAFQAVTITDKQAMTAPLYETAGAEIYTSPYQEGSTGANLPPPVCKAMAQWGTYTFYGNITEDPQVIVDIPAGTLDDGGSPPTVVGYTTTIRKNGIGRRTVTGSTTIGNPTITGVSAADMVGIVPGQQVWSSSAITGFVTGTAIISVTASTITMAANATIGGSHIVNFDDVLEINGHTERVLNGLTAGMPGQWLSGQAAIYASATCLIETQQPVICQGVTYVVQGNRSGIYTSLTARATNGANYSPPLPEISATVKTITTVERPNLLRWSKSNQPEAVPTPNEAFIGNGSIINMFPLTDALIILCTDGAYRLTGDGGVWRSDIVDPTFVPCTPDACCVLNDVVYAYTARGFCSLQGITTSLLSRGVIDAQFPGRPFEEKRTVHMCANTTTEEIITVLQDTVSLFNAATVYVYSTLYKQWSTYAPTFRLYTALGLYNDGTPGSLPFVIFGEFNAPDPPAMSLWREAAGLLGDTLYMDLQMQPVYAGDTAINKHWIDATWIMDGTDFAPQLVQSVNNGQSSGFGQGNPTPGQTGQETRCSMGIARKAAISPFLQLGVNIGSHDPSGNIPVTLKGVSIRFKPLATQQGRR